MASVPLPLVVVLALVAMAVVWALAQSGSEGKDAVSDTARLLGLLWKPGTLGYGNYEGRIGRSSVRLQHVSDNRGERVRLEAVGPETSAFSFESESVGSRVSKLWKDEVQLGDAAFDDGVFLRGDAVGALVIFDAPLRADILAVVAAGASLRENRMEAVLPGVNAGAITDVATRLARIAERLATPATGTADELLARLAPEESAGVRRKILECLAEKFPGVASPALELVASSDRDPELRVLAARMLVASGTSAFLVAIARDASLPIEIRAKALAEAASVAGPTPLDDLLPEFLAAAPSLCLAALEAALDGTSTRWRPPQKQVRLLAQDSWIAIRRAAARLLDAGDPASASFLDLFVGSEDLLLQISAVNALGETGSVAAVERLRPLTDGILADARLKYAARAAIAAIQARAGGERGALSVAPESAGGGAVSLDDPRGALSPTDETAPMPAARPRPTGEKR